MSIIDQLLAFFMSTVGMITGGILIGGIGIVVYLYKFSDITSKGMVILLRPRDKRGEFVPIEKEEEFLLKCKSKDGIKRTYVKSGNGWTINKKNYFLGVEGSGYTSILNKADKSEMPIEEYLKAAWGDVFFKKISETRLNQLKIAPIVVSVEPTKVDIDGSGLPRLSSEDLEDKEDSIVLEKLAKSVEATKPKADLILLALAFGCGAGAILLLKAIGWLKF